MIRPTRRALVTMATAFSCAAILTLAGCNSSGNETAGTTTASGNAPTAAPKSEMPTKLTMGFVPSVEADKIADDAQPVADYLTKELGIPVTNYTSTDYVGLVEAMSSGRVDIGALPPLAYVLAKDKGAAEVILKASRKGKLTYRSMFVVKADSGIKTLADAKGKRMAFVEPASTSGYLFPAALLKRQGNDPEKYFSQLTFAGSHDKAAMAVYNGDVDIASVFEDVRNSLEKTTPDIKQKVIPIAYSDEIPNDTFSVRPGLPQELKDKIKKALLAFSKTPDGLKVMKAIDDTDGMTEVQDSDYDPVREVARSMGVNLEMFKKDKKAASSPAAPSPSAAPAMPKP